VFLLLIVVQVRKLKAIAVDISTEVKTQGQGRFDTFSLLILSSFSSRLFCCLSRLL
jgi:hypothetical protein